MIAWGEYPKRASIESLYDSLAEPVAVVDDELLIIWANRSALSLFGGMRMPDGIQTLLAHEDLPRVQQSLSKGKSVSAAGGRLPLFTSGLFFQPLGREEENALTLVHIQISEGEGSYHDPQGASRVVASFSRQMRTPLSRIFAALSTLSRLLEVQGLAEMKEPLQSINHNGYQLLRHCINVSEMTRFQAGVNTPSFSAIDLCDLVREIGRATEILIGDLGISLKVLTPKAPLICRTDPEKLQLALFNILSNSCKFTRAGNCIFLSLEKSPGGARITVTDRGQGILPDVLPMIFEPFYSCSGDDPSRFGGGIGLSVAKMCLSTLGGGITVSSTPGKGTTVVLSLPAELPTEGDLRLDAPRVIDYMTDRFSLLYVILSDVCASPEA